MKIKKITPTDGINARSHRRENAFQNSLELVAYSKGSGIVELASLRIYGTQAKNYACLWVHDRKSGIHCSGSGSAGGYGYHRPSAAAAEAFQSAGIELSKHIGGVGESAMKEALNALAKKLGYTQFSIIEAHG